MPVECLLRLMTPDGCLVPYNSRACSVDEEWLSDWRIKDNFWGPQCLIAR